MSTVESTDEHFMRLALKSAERAALSGDVPVGCVIVDHDGTILAAEGNRREQDQDPTAHAEIVAMRTAADARGHWRLDGTTLYVTLEPCAMCAGAMVNARIGRVVYGCSDPKSGAVRSLYEILGDPRLNHQARVVAGVLAAESVQQLRAFFAKLRAQGEK